MDITTKSAEEEKTVKRSVIFESRSNSPTSDDNISVFLKEQKAPITRYGSINRSNTDQQVSVLNQYSSKKMLNEAASSIKFQRILV